MLLSPHVALVAQCWGAAGRVAGGKVYSGQLGTGKGEPAGGKQGSMGESLPPLLFGLTEPGYDVVDLAAGLYRTCVVYKPTNSTYGATQVRW